MNPMLNININNMMQTITDITSYDVLADPSMEGVVGEYQLENYKKTVGNNRLKVFLALHQQDYDRARQQNNVLDCEYIVANVYETLNKKCVPTGRFLINAVADVGMNGGAQSSPVWKLMGEREAKQLIHGILKGVPPPDLYYFRQQQNGAAGNGKEEHKRRRRSSLLRRSASESLLDDSKKVSRFDQEFGFEGRRMSREEPTWSSSRRITNNGNVSLNRMDVILTSTMDALDPNCQSIGNNRLHILVAMQSGKYQQANDRQKDAILEEVMQTVNSFWKGRFLAESMSGCYEVLDHGDAKRSLRHIFEMRSGQNLLSQSSSAPAMNITPNVPSRLNNNSDAVGSGGRANHEFNITNNNNSRSNGNQLLRNDPMNMMRGASTSTLPIGNNNFISEDTKKMLSRQMSSSLLPTPISNNAMNNSMPRIEPPIALSGINDLRSAAIKSLQKQKARQKVANKIEKVSMRNSSQQQLQIQQQLIQPNSINIMNGISINNNNNFPPFSTGGAGPKRRQSSIFGALDPTIMDEIVDGCFDDD